MNEIESDRIQNSPPCIYDLCDSPWHHDSFQNIRCASKNSGDLCDDCFGDPEWTILSLAFFVMNPDSLQFVEN